MSHLATELDSSVEQAESKLKVFSQQKITEAQYWEKYYETGEINYEWNNGYLEEKPVSDYATTLIYNWFVALLRFYFETYNNGCFTNLEMGFRLDLGKEKLSIRKPDLGVICKTNPKPLLLRDRSYKGIFDLCVEALSDSTKKERERDTKTKKQEYARAGVKEYYILHDDKRGVNDGVEFYQLDKGVYQPIKRREGDIIQSTVFPGFQFRIADLYQRPTIENMSVDKIYQDFVFPHYKIQKQRAESAERRAASEAQRADNAEQQLIKEAQRAEQEINRLKVQLKGYESI
jgi:Uma2 family endonuclease